MESMNIYKNLWIYEKPRFEQRLGSKLPLKNLPIFKAPMTPDPRKNENEIMNIYESLRNLLNEWKNMDSIQSL